MLSAALKRVYSRGEVLAAALKRIYSRGEVLSAALKRIYSRGEGLSAALKRVYSRGESFADGQKWGRLLGIDAFACTLKLIEWNKGEAGGESGCGFG